MKIANSVIPGMEAFLDEAKNDVNKHACDEDTEYTKGYYEGAKDMCEVLMAEFFGDGVELIIMDGHHEVVPL